jgi:IclR family transcriptional regulator, acetate operon repressor
MSSKVGAVPADGDQPLDRAFLVMGAVLDAPGPVSVTTLAERTSLPLASVHRLAAQLERRGLLSRALGSRRLLPGPRLLRFGLDIARGGALRDPVQAILAGVAEEIGEQCQIGVVSGHEIVFLGSARPARAESGGLQFEPGQRAPIHCTSTGKLFLAQLQPERLRQMLRALPRRRYTASTIVSAAALLVEVEAVRARGWASSNEEYVAGVVGCAVPILRPGGGEMVASLAVSIPAARREHGKLRALIPPLRRAAEALGAVLDGGSGAG